MIVIKEETDKQLQGLENLYLVCGDDLIVSRRNLKSELGLQIGYLKWKNDRLAVEEWCKIKKVDLLYFDTIIEYEEWKTLDITKYKLENEQKNRVDRLKELVDKSIRHKESLIKEIKNLESDMFYEIDESVIIQEE